MMTLILLLMMMSLSDGFKIVQVKNIRESFEEKNRGKRETISTMPENLDFRLIGKDKDSILKLTKLPGIPTYIFTGNELEIQYGESQNAAVYTDNIKKSALVIRRKDDFAEAFELEGDVDVNGEIMYISPFYRHTGTYSNGKVDHKLRKITAMNIDHGNRRDFRGIKRKKRHTKRQYDSRQKRSIREYTVELCFIADAEDYHRFLKLKNNNATETILEMNIYYSFVAEQIRLRYESTYEHDLSFVIHFIITGLIIIKDRLDLLDGIVNRKKQVDYNDGLNVATEWLFEHAEEFPVSDHYMFFTSYDLTDKGDPDSLGLANLGSMCYRNEDGYIQSISIIENSFDGNVGATAAHELGHSLGADHDSDAGCNDNDLYLMSERSLHPKSSKYASRPWRFSNCSIRDISIFLDSANVTCLQDHHNVDDIISKSGHIDGVFYDVDDQCQMAFGSKSRFCKGKYLGKENNETFCYKLYCTLYRDRCKPIFPRDYTSCGYKEWCFKGQCISNDVKRIRFENIPTSVNLLNGTSEVINKILITGNNQHNIIFNYLWKPHIANTYFNFNNTTGRVSVNVGVVLNISEAEVVVTATDGTSTTPPAVIKIYIFDITQAPRFTNESFELLLYNVREYSVVVKNLSYFLLSKEQTKQLTFKLSTESGSDQFTIDNHTGEIQIIKPNSLIYCHQKQKISIITVEAIYRNFLTDSATMILICRELTTIEDVDSFIFHSRKNIVRIIYGIIGGLITVIIISIIITIICITCQSR